MSARDSDSSQIANYVPMPEQSLLRRRLEEIRESLDSITERVDKQVNTPIPINIQERELQPGKGLDTDWSIILSHGFRSAGYAGLVNATQKLALEIQADSRNIIAESYDEIANGNSRPRLMMILATMHSEFLEALLDGTLFYKIESDEKFEQRVNNHRLRKIPGNYVQALVRQGPNDPDPGKSLTLRELQIVYNTARTYLPSNPSTDSVAAHRIDKIFQPGAVGTFAEYRRDGVRKYSPSEVAEQKTGVWLDSLKEKWIDRIELQDPNNPNLDEPMVWAPLHVGFGIDLFEMASAHDEHPSSNYLFTFYQALVRYTCDPDDDIFYVVTRGTHVIFVTNDPYGQAKLGDVAMTMLAQSGWFQGGLNPESGGGADISQDLVESKISWIEKSAERLFRPGALFQDNVQNDVEKLKHFEYLTCHSDADAETVKAQTRRDRLSRRCEEVDAELDDMEGIVSSKTLRDSTSS